MAAAKSLIFLSGSELPLLCAFARSFPSFVEKFLQSGSKLRRRFREETITDLMMGSLLSLGGSRVIVEFPNEPVTGADMQWDFVNQDNGTFFRYGTFFALTSSIRLGPWPFIPAKVMQSR